jgi:hypothetical protein
MRKSRFSEEQIIVILRPLARPIRIITENALGTSSASRDVDRSLGKIDQTNNRSVDRYRSA